MCLFIIIIIFIIIIFIHSGNSGYQILLKTLMFVCLFLCICLWLSVLSVLSNIAPNVDVCLFGIATNKQMENSKPCFTCLEYTFLTGMHIFCPMTIKWRDLLELKSMFQLSFIRFKFQITWPDHFPQYRGDVCLGALITTNKQMENIKPYFTCSE